MDCDPHRYTALLSRLYARTKEGMKPGLNRVSAALRELGDPQRRYATVHIAGTNGKGSTAAMVASCLQQAGYGVGLYTSPHLQRFTERIRVNGVEIAPAEAVSLGERLLEGRGPLSFFELVTVLAFAHFAARGVDIAVIETGLGGRLDATNVVVPEVAVITSIGLDHAEILGHSISQIAGEKAGIIKAGVPAVAVGSPPEVAEVCVRTAAAVGAPLKLLGREIVYVAQQVVPLGRDGKTSVSVAIDGKNRGPFTLGLAGAHQCENAALAVAAIDALTSRGFTITPSAVAAGLSEARWPGRLEQVGRVLLDVAHNEAGMDALVQALGGSTRYVVIFGAMGDKPVVQMLTALRPHVGRLVLTQVRSQRAWDPEALRRELGFGEVVPSVEAALRCALADGAPVLVTGSVYLVGAIRGLLLGEESDPVVLADPVCHWARSGPHPQVAV